MTRRPDLSGLVSERSLEKLADKRSFDRGLAYFREGAVELEALRIAHKAKRNFIQRLDAMASVSPKPARRPELP